VTKFGEILVTFSSGDKNKINWVQFAPIHQKNLEIPFGHPLFISYWE
jgi:hypothetical protein